MFQPGKVIKSIAYVASALGISFSLGYFALAWTAPTAAPPGVNVSTPLNIGSTGQSKAGGLILNTGGAANGLIVQSGNVGIGTSSPGGLLDINGAMIFRATTQPAVSSSNQAVIYLDSATGSLNVSINGQPYAPLMRSVAAFGFNNQTGVDLSSTITSEVETLGGGFTNLTATCGAGCAKISINGGPFTAGPVTGVNSGNTIAIQLTSSASYSTTVTASVTVGSVSSSTWSVTTGPSVNCNKTYTANATVTAHNFSVAYTIKGGGGGAGGAVVNNGYGSAGGAGGTSSFTNNGLTIASASGGAGGALSSGNMSGNSGQAGAQTTGNYSFSQGDTIVIHVGGGGGGGGGANACGGGSTSGSVGGDGQGGNGGLGCSNGTGGGGGGGGTGGTGAAAGDGASGNTGSNGGAIAGGAGGGSSGGAGGSTASSAGSGGPGVAGGGGGAVGSILFNYNYTSCFL